MCPFIFTFWIVSLDGHNAKLVSKVDCGYKKIHLILLSMVLCLASKIGLYAIYLSRNAGIPSNDYLHAKTIVQFLFTAPISQRNT